MFRIIAVEINIVSNYYVHTAQEFIHYRFARDHVFFRHYINNIYCFDNQLCVVWAATWYFPASLLSI